MTSLPRHWASAGYGVPTVCARHGEPAAQYRSTRFVSRPPSWAAPLILLGALPYVIVVLATRKTVTVPNWPFCARCRSTHQRLLVIGLIVLALAAVLFVIGLSNPAASSTDGLIILGSLITFFGGVITTSRSGWPLIAKVVLSQDGQFLQFTKPDPRFAAQVDAAVQASRAAQARAAQMQAAQPQASNWPTGGYTQPGPR